MRRAFTLVELVLVLAILSILSLMAVRQLGRGQAEQVRRASDESLEAIERAILGDPIRRDGTVRDPAGRIIATSFVSDVGRLPRAWANPEEGRDPDRLTLCELFVKPDDLPSYGYRPAVAGNFSAATTNVRHLAACSADACVGLACGWDGPYLREQFDASGAFLRDGWGNPYVARLGQFCVGSMCEATILPAEFAQWRDSYGTAAPSDACLTNGFPIAYVRHLGADGIEDVTEARLWAVTNAPEFAVNRDRVVSLTNMLAGTVACQFRVSEEFTPKSYGLRVYGPEEGRVGVWEWTGASAACSVGFAGLSVGRKKVRAWAVNAANVTNYSAVLTHAFGTGSNDLETIDVHWPRPERPSL